MNNLAAYSRDGLVVNINHHNSRAEQIPGLLEWAEANGVVGYVVVNDRITFANMVDVDLFWLTFYNPREGIHVRLRGKVDWTEASQEAKRLKRLAMDTDRSVVMVRGDD